MWWVVAVVMAQPASAPVSAAPASAAPASAAAAPASTAGARVTLRGRAEDAKLAAALLTADGQVVYLIELPSWPAHQRGHEVEVTGVLEVTDQFKAEVDAQGNHSQGTAGGDTLLRRAEVRVLD